jgi:ATP-binding cassette subfamily F protein 1
MGNSIVTLFSEKISIDINGKKLINESDIAINSGTKYFVVGQNGIGKTTLLKNIFNKLSGIQENKSNNILKNNFDVLMLDQDIIIESESETIEEFILNADPLLNKYKKRMDELELLNELNDDETEEYNKLSEIIYQKEWDKYEAESKRIINGLGFENPTLPVNILSGGKRMILAIGKALLRKPDILLMDEPTNHLDLDVVIWLTNYLESYKKTLIVITHQIGLVNSIADIIWYIGNPELTGNKIYTIRGKYDKLIKFLEITPKEVENKWEKFNKKVEELKKKSTPKKVYSPVFMAV